MRRSKTYITRDYGQRSDTFMDGKLTEIFYRLPRKNVNYRILVDRKQYWRRDVSYDQAALGRESDDPRTWLKRLLSDDYVKLDRTTIDGVVVEGIEGRRLESGGETVMRFWVDVETNLPVRIEMTGMEGGQMMKIVMENFEWNVQLDESFFEPNIPADYTPQEDRPKQAGSARAVQRPAGGRASTDRARASGRAPNPGIGPPVSSGSPRPELGRDVQVCRRAGRALGRRQNCLGHPSGRAGDRRSERADQDEMA